MAGLPVVAEDFLGWIALRHEFLSTRESPIPSITLDGSPRERTSS
jgi:hypothetical protein